jgi:hypothetical protein
MSSTRNQSRKFYVFFPRDTHTEKRDMILPSISEFVEVSRPSESETPK